MRTRVSQFFLASALAAPAMLVACSSSSSTPGTDAGTTDSGVTADAGAASDSGATADASTPSDSGVKTDSGTTADAGTPGDSGPPLTLTRVAHLSPGAPSVDFCLIPHGAAGGFGPVAGADGGVVPQAPIFGSIGLSAGIAYGQVSTYDPGGAPAGSYDFRVVAAGTVDCSKAGVADFPSVALPAGHVTIAATGLLGADAGPAFALTIYNDDPAAGASGALLRFVHASPGTPPVNVGTLSDAGLATIFADVAFGQVATTDGGVDKNGYAALPPIAAPGVTVAAAVYNADAAAPLSVAISVPGVTLAGGETATAFAIGQLSGSADAGTSLGVLLCNDFPADAGFALLNPSCITAH